MKRLLAISATALLASMSLAVPAWAADMPEWAAKIPFPLPTPAQGEIVIFPSRDFVVTEGYPANTRLDITVNRPGVGAVGKATGTTDRTGFLEVNHPGGICWGAKQTDPKFNVTPDIKAGDVVVVNPAALGVPTNSSKTLNVEVTRQDVNGTPENLDDDVAANIENGNLVVKGTAFKANGTPVTGTDAAADMIEQRIINPDFRDPTAPLSPGETETSRIIKRDIRADTGGGLVKGVDGAQGNLTFDGSGNWTATYTGLNATELRMATEGGVRVLGWLDTTNADDRLGVTIFEDGESGGPGMGGCPPGPAGAVPTTPPDSPILRTLDTNPSAPADTYRYNSVYDSASELDPTIPQYKPIVNLLDPAVAGTDLAQLHEVVVFSERDFVVAEGYPANTNLEIVVRRPGVGIIGSAAGNTGNAGILEVNHPGGEVWTGQTPDIKPGDIVDVVKFDDPDGSVAATGAKPGGKNGDEVATGGETQRTINATVKTQANGKPYRIVDPSTARTGDRRLIVEGSFFKPDPNNPGAEIGVTGSMPEASLIEQRIINPDMNDTIVSRRDIRASFGTPGRVPGGVTATLTFPKAGQWRAVYTGLDKDANGTAPGTTKLINIVTEGEFRALSWLAFDGERRGITIFEAGQPGGPGMGGAPARSEPDELSLPIAE